MAEKDKDTSQKTDTPEQDKDRKDPSVCTKPFDTETSRLSDGDDPCKSGES